jgi:flagellar M-ring protein FliF
MAKDSLFVDQEEPAKASVVLRLKSSRPLAPATVKGIANLVAGSVESLRPESVVILDTYGRSLTRPDDGDDAGGAADVDRQQRIERDLSTRVVTLLEPVVGPGRVRVNVAAHLNSSAVDETEEHWDPATVVRSRQTSTETGALASAAGGVAGARANQPPALSTSNAPKTANAGATAAGAKPGEASAPSASLAVAAPSAPSRTSETTNYEVGHVTRHTVSPEGGLARLSVAVILDDERVSTKGGDGTTQVTTQSWDAKDVQRIHDLVAAAVGLDPQRGDQLTVENIAFDVPAAQPPAPRPTVLQQLTDLVRDHGLGALRGVAIVGIALFALFGVLRPIARHATKINQAPALPAPGGAAAARLPTVQEMEGQIEAELDAAGPGNPRRLPVLTKRVAKLANDEPEQLARIVRGWIAEDEH